MVRKRRVIIYLHIDAMKVSLDLEAIKVSTIQKMPILLAILKISLEFQQIEVGPKS